VSIFFRLFNSADEREVGFVPQVYKAKVDFDINGPDSSIHLNLSPSESNTKWPVPILAKRAKKTDLISVSFAGLSNCLLVSKKLYLIFNQFRQQGVQFIETPLFFSDGSSDTYWIVNPYLTSFSVLNVRDCEFIFTDRFGKVELRKVQYEKTEDLERAFKENRADATRMDTDFSPLWIDSISFVNEISIDFVFVPAMRYGYLGYFVSKQLKDEIVNQKCTGLVFTDPNENYP